LRDKERLDSVITTTSLLKSKKFIVSWFQAIQTMVFFTIAMTQSRNSFKTILVATKSISGDQCFQPFFVHGTLQIYKKNYNTLTLLKMTIFGTLYSKTSMKRQLIKIW
jgi:hypothetical protein